MHLEVILAVIVIYYLRKSLKAEGLPPRWDKILSTGMAVAIALLVIEILLSERRDITIWLVHAFFLSLIYITFTVKEFQRGKPIMYAVLPYVVVAILSDTAQLIAADFYNEWYGYFNTASVFATIWMFAMWITTRKQTKALEKEQLKTQEKEKENQVTASLKAALEVQVAERTAALTMQKEELQHALDDLKATQAQLIQSEKMASLGELTAGIAHEIQNPLNFVNNFSELNTELIDELKQEIDKGNFAEVKAIAKDIAANEHKINHHGKRADAIVKGMLQHSRSSNAVKEPTDINELADEYLRLAYHGLRAKDKTFNATMETDFDQNIGSINIIPQDIGRVILNLITNAFYAVTDKKKKAGPLPGTPGYEPKVTVSTKKVNDKIEIKVKDNGNGIPQMVIDKIFQPFFTTKPTGQGTGLGLSLSYDIVKAHSGEIKVKTREGEGTEFILQLPDA